MVVVGARSRGLDETAFDNPMNFTYPAGCYVAEVEIDRETGSVVPVKFTGADDFGRIINPMIVEGQVLGALVQGIGQALCENASYDPGNGQLQTGSFMGAFIAFVLQYKGWSDHLLPVQMLLIFVAWDSCDEPSCSGG